MEIQYRIEDDRPLGGQSCGKMSTTVIGYIEELGIEIKCSHYKAHYKNKELVKEVFECIEVNLKNKAKKK